jgi:hypothetical protein
MLESGDRIGGFRMDTNTRMFLPATSTATDTQTGEIVYVSGIYSITERAIIWFTISGFKTQKEAILFANQMANELELDFVNFLETGEKSEELYAMMKEVGVFLDPDNSTTVVGLPISKVTQPVLN